MLGQIRKFVNADQSQLDAKAIQNSLGKQSGGFVSFFQKNQVIAVIQQRQECGRDC